MTSISRGDRQHLLDAAVREVAIHVSGRKSVIGAQRLDLRDRCVVGAKVPKTNIVEQRGILHGIDRRLPGGNKGKFLGIPIQAEGNRSRLDMPLDIGPLNRNLIRPHIDGMDDERQSGLQNKKAHDQDGRILVSPQPNKWQGPKRDHNEQPAQGQRELFVHVIRARHEGMGVEQKFIVAEINPGGKAEQQDNGNDADETRTRSARQQQGARPNRKSFARPVLETAVAKFFRQLPAFRRCPKNQGAKNRQHEHKSQHFRIEGQIEKIKRQAAREHLILPGIGGQP